jgi:hypothetical protein
VDSDRVRVEFVDQKIDQVLTCYLTLPQYIRTTVTVYSGGASAESKQGQTDLQNVPLWARMAS